MIILQLESKWCSPEYKSIDRDYDSRLKFEAHFDDREQVCGLIFFTSWDV